MLGETEGEAVGARWGGDGNRGLLGGERPAVKIDVQGKNVESVMIVRFKSTLTVRCGATCARPSLWAGGESEDEGEGEGEGAEVVARWVAA